MKKVILTDLIFEEKRQKTLDEKLNCEFIRINTSKEGYDADYEASSISKFISNFNFILILSFISKFKDKDKENKIKELEDEIKKLKLQLTYQSK